MSDFPEKNENKIEGISEDTEKNIEAEENPEAADNAEEKPAKPFGDAVDWIGCLVNAVLIMLVLNLFMFRSITVQGTSMCDTLQDQDKVIATNFLYTPKRGDIVVVQADKLINQATGLYGEPIIKRVIGLEGDIINFDFDNGIIYRNGIALSEDYITGPTYNPEGCVSGVDYTVPEHCVFVMGDNRAVSRDSRDMESVGFVDIDLIMGKAFFRIYPLEKIGLL